MDKQILGKSKNVIVLFGGNSPEHEVSVISGLQVIENIDRELFKVFAIKLTKSGVFEYYEGLNKRDDYLRISPKIVNFGNDGKGPYFQTSGVFGKKIYVDAAFLAFHGGNGESGQVQGFLETINIPYTSPSVESSAISMNKAFTKQILALHKIQTVEGVSVFDKDIKKNVDNVIQKLNINLPVIVKPVHLGSSIGINIAKTKIELKKYLLEASHYDSEILIEKLISNFKEYNVSVRQIDGKIQTSEIEKPLSNDEILSFADKYQKGGKKSGGGMANLNRELPAKIPIQLENKLKNIAIEVFKAIRAKGVVRIDFIVGRTNTYVTEVNPIPGSMSYYLWEASGISFRDQITELIKQAVIDFERKKLKNIEYKSDIIDKFISQK